MLGFYKSPSALCLLIACVFCPSSNASLVEVDSLRELRKAAKESNQEVRMAPGHYKIKGFEDTGTTVMEFSGSNNTFDLTGVTIEFPTELFNDMTRTKVHGLRKYTMYGDKLTFKGGRFVDSGDTPPNVSVASIFIEGDDVSFIDCQFSVRGSAPYGVGDMLGKGRGSAVKLRKHSVICITGDRPLIKDCLVRVHTYGHGIHIHGSQDAHLDGVIMLGNQRNTSDILDSKDPLMKGFGYKYQYPDWKKGQPIPRDEMIGLTEDGIRAYLQGDHKSGETRRTGHILVENCKINGMRGGITLAIGGSATVRDSLAINCSHGFSLPSNSTIENCQANVANGPALSLPYSHKGNSTVEIELIEETGEPVGTHPLAEITGSGHDITFTMASGAKPKRLRPILIGSTGERYTEDSTENSELAERNKASKIKLRNKTPHSVVLGRFSDDCDVRSNGEKIKE